MPEQVTIRQASRKRRWISFFLAVLIFSLIWIATGQESAALFQLPWNFIAVLVMQAAILVIWDKPWREKSPPPK